MGTHKKLTGMLAALLLSALNTTTARAQLITEYVNYNMVSSAVGLVSGYSSIPTYLSLNPFDSTLGQLDAVEVSITGNAIITMQTGLNYYIGAGGFPIYTPYNIQTTLNLGFNGLTDYFDTYPDLGGTFSNTVTGLGDAAANLTSYSMGFRIDSASELLGTYAPADSAGFSGTAGGLTSYPLVYGTRNDFLDSVISSDLMQLTLDTGFIVIANSPQTPTTVTTNSFGLMQVDYYYTPAEDLVDSQVPEPHIFWLFGTGLGLIILAKYRMKTGSGLNRVSTL